MNQRNQNRLGSSSQDRNQDRGDRGRQGRNEGGYGSSGWSEGSYRGGAMRGSSYGGDREGFDRDDHGSDRDRDERFGTQGYGMSDYGWSRGGGESDMRDHDEGRGRSYGDDAGGGMSRRFGSSDWRGGRGQEWGETYGGSRNANDDRWASPGRGAGRGLRGSNDYASQSWRGGEDFRGSHGLSDGMLGYGYGSGYGMQGSGGMSSSIGGGFGMRQGGGPYGYGDVSDFGRGGGGHGRSMGTGIDYGASYDRGNQHYGRGRGEDDRSFGDRVEEWGHRAKEGIKEFFGGPKNYKRSDERIREDVCDRLQQLGNRGHLDPSDIEVSVKDGEVTLSGSVPQRDWKHRAEDLAESVSGVKEVDNRIRIQRQDSGLSSGKSGRAGGTASTSSTASTLGGNGNHSTSASTKS